MSVLTRLPGAITEHSIKAEPFHRGMRHCLPVLAADFVAALRWEATEVCAQLTAKAPHLRLETSHTGFGWRWILNPATSMATGRWMPPITLCGANTTATTQPP